MNLFTSAALQSECGVIIWKEYANSWWKQTSMSSKKKIYIYIYIYIEIAFDPWSIYSEYLEHDKHDHSNNSLDLSLKTVII